MAPLTHAPHPVIPTAGIDGELRLLLALSRRLPRLRGSVRIAHLLRDFYLRKQREPVVADVLGFKMVLDPHDWVESGFLFWPQLWDFREMQFMRRKLRAGDVFLDVGSHIGFNTLYASRLVSNSGLVMSIEADPELHSLLRTHLDINQIKNVRSINIAVSDRAGTVYLSRQVAGNRAGRSLLTEDRLGTAVTGLPLAEVLRDHGLSRISGAWFEIGGSEFKVLHQFFDDAEPALWPRFLIVEHNPGWAELAGGDVAELLHKIGYREWDARPVAPGLISNKIFLWRS